MLTEAAPEISSGSVEIVGIAREPGARTMISVNSKDPSVDPVGACVGRRGAIIKSLAARFSEKIDVIRWSEHLETYIRNLFGPAKIEWLEIDPHARQIKAYLRPDQLRLISGKYGTRLKLISKLVDYEVIVGDYF